MSKTLLVLMAASTLICAFNVVFYARFFWKAPGYGNALLTLYPCVFLISSYLETNRLEANLRGGTFMTFPWMRMAVAVAMLVVTLSQAILALVYYSDIIKNIEKQREKSGWNRL